MTDGLESRFVEVPLTKGMVAIIDPADSDKVFAHRWFAEKGNGGHYAEARPVWYGPALAMHNLILGAARAVFGEFARLNFPRVGELSVRAA